MPSESAQILNLLADRRIDLREAERLLAVVGGRDRYFTLAIGILAAAIIASVGVQPVHFVDNLNAALQSLTGSPAFHQLQVFCIRLLGELP